MLKFLRSISKDPRPDRFIVVESKGLSGATVAADLETRRTGRQGDLSVLSRVSCRGR